MSVVESTDKKVPLSGKTGTRIAFDPGLVATGYAVGRGSNTLFSSGTIRPKGDTKAERLSSLLTDIDAIFQTFGPLFCDIEVAGHFAYERSRDAETDKMLNARSLILNGYATAIIFAVAGRHGIPVEERRAHSWKMVRGRNMDKEQMIRLAYSHCPGLREKGRFSSHEAEAVCLLFTGRP